MFRGQFSLKSLIYALNFYGRYILIITLFINYRQICRDVQAKVSE